jgi:hypothetical protein
MRLALILALAFLFASPTESQQGVAPPPINPPSVLR